MHKAKNSSNEPKRAFCSPLGDDLDAVERRHTGPCKIGNLRSDCRTSCQIHTIWFITAKWPEMGPTLPTALVSFAAVNFAATNMSSVEDIENGDLPVPSSVLDAYAPSYKH